MFNVVLISDKDENAINTVNTFYFTHRNVLIQIQSCNFIKVPASLVFAAISEFCFTGFSRPTIYKLITSSTLI